MTWEGFYLVCFGVGFLFAVLGFLGGVLDWPLSHVFHIHLPGHAGQSGTHGAGAHGHGHSAFNFATAMAFLAWFGGMGYLLSIGGHLPALLVLAAAVVSGLAGGAIVFVFLTRVLLRHEQAPDALDADMIGVLARVTVPIREGGTGEIVYSQAGTRKSSAARHEKPGGIPRGVEVVVTRFERGIAFVRLWDEITGGDEEALPEKAPNSPSTEPRPQVH
jgi:membrane protein implicated in regulation of membrane protease activity